MQSISLACNWNKWYSLIASSVIKIIGDSIDPNSKIGLLFQTLGEPTLVSLVGARILFNMKEAGERGLNQGTSCEVKSTIISIMDFAAPPDSVAEDSVEAIAESKGVMTV